MSTESDPDLTVVYNDTCPICAREVAGYKRRTRAQGLDVTYLGLDEAEMVEAGLDRADAARRFHVIRDGELISGMPAFAVLWDRIPGLRWLARLVRLPVIAPLSAALYDHVAAPLLFALHRRRERLGKAWHRG
ncbi:thiol-disulfide oxidoreductase DCC family protein [Thalassococcus sp. BH17M4-6]|uniref:thiol-disulfide oxidoreductase DCC family protein n=1 Tax=Thalassococcus sp. BH17M4-6 TaxID=3413148 RepID=UPI003BBFD724